MRKPKDIPTEEILKLVDNPKLCGNCRKDLELELSTRDISESFDSSKSRVHMKEGVPISKSTGVAESAVNVLEEQLDRDVETMSEEDRAREEHEQEQEEEADAHYMDSMNVTEEKVGEEIQEDLT